MMRFQDPFAPKACSSAFSAAEFFRDSPWLNIPKERQGEILVEPLFPRGGLLGGSSSQNGPPKTKLAALAAARKLKSQNTRSGQNQTTTSVALLDKLRTKTQDSKIDPKLDLSKDEVTKPQYPAPRNKNSDQVEKAHPIQGAESAVRNLQPSHETTDAEVAPAGPPSSFARTIFGSSWPSHSLSSHPVQLFDIRALQASEFPTEFNFTGPSPDDVVIKAQSSRNIPQKSTKGQTQPAHNDNNLNNVTQSIGDIRIEDTTIKGRNLDVVAEYKRSKQKNAANFVVIGMLRLDHYNKVLD